MTYFTYELVMLLLLEPDELTIANTVSTKCRAICLRNVLSEKTGCHLRNLLTPGRRILLRKKLVNIRV